MKVERKTIKLRLSEEEVSCLRTCVEADISLNTEDLRDRIWVSEEGREATRREQKVLRRLRDALRKVQG